MTRMIARHRAAAGILALLALVLFYTLPEETGDAWGDVAMATLDVLMLLVVIAGGWALFTSPYFNILHRESPLRRAATGITDLDERELALRDRASGLTYNLFVVLNMIAIGALALAIEQAWVVLDGDMLMKAFIPYSYVSLFLPVLTLEWFEPSSLWATPIDDEEEA
ncbi:hypothetical protein E2493_12270 [Sphingomonas parva]|uniref:Uncharacterized protein n=1 Tax=Sphingomonas parva TaxID=2555898 RepID=A0A4Y8ZS67_9SPHN|nr:hypothetical protein [Sphingomonas parva]TFI57965.1 hypothetical protein E2493_12270 [Sphingomonas parva]